MTAPNIAAAKAALAHLDLDQNPVSVRAKSRDFFWYSPVLKARLDHLTADFVVAPRTEAEVIEVLRVCHAHNVPVTPRGTGTGNYGQAIPLAGGCILHMHNMNAVKSIAPGRVVVEPGALLTDVDAACIADSAQELRMYSSTWATATVGGFIAGGSGGVGSVRWGGLRDIGNIIRLRVVTMEAAPRVLEMTGEALARVSHAYGTNGIITALDFRLRPATDWRHVIALFDGYEPTLRAAVSAHAAGHDCYLLSVVERRFARFYRRLDGIFAPERDAIFAMVAPDAMSAFCAHIATAGGHIALDLSLDQLDQANLPPAWECGWNHTTLQALKHEPGVWTYSQIAYPQPFDPSVVPRQMARTGDEVYWHHEIAMMNGTLQVFAIPLVRWTDPARVRTLQAEVEALDGCTVFDPHAYTIEDGGMKAIDTTQIDFKRRADPQGLMNPGKTRGWTPDKAL